MPRYLGLAKDEEEQQAEEKGAVGSGRHRKIRLVVSAAAGALVATVVAGSFVAATAATLARSPRAANEAKVRDATSLAVLYEALQTCYGNTGSACAKNGSCTASLGHCQSSMCVCQLGCSGADGKCYQEANMLIAADFKLSNAQWTSHAMYFQSTTSTHGQLSSTSLPTWLNLESDKFNLYRLPSASNGQPMFLLGSSKWIYQTTIVRVSSSLSSILDHGMYATNLALGQGVSDLAVYVCYCRNEKTLRIGDQDQQHWAYLRGGQIDVFASSFSETQQEWSGPWKEAEWKPDPEFTPPQVAMLPPC